MLLATATENRHMSSSPVPFGNDAIPNMKMQQQQPIDEAQFIIQKSYAESYGRMMSCEPHIIENDCIKLVIDDIIMKQQHVLQQQQRAYINNTMNANAPEDVIFVSKLSSLSSSQNSISTSIQQSIPDDHPYPWWFTTLLRDILTNGVYGPWHHFSTVGTTPPIRFCAMGKNACTEWRRVFKALNAPEFCSDGDEKEKTNDGGGGGGAGGECQSQFNTATPLSHDPNTVPNAVFIRDPLERLLSAYLDKCIKPNIRRSQGHCEPNTIFGVDYLEWIADKSNNYKQQQQEGNSNDEVATKPLPDLMQTLQNRDKELFAAYVDLLPLKWNVHFVPQAITCDLYRNFHTYDFVGVMGKHFISELDRMVHRYGNGDASSSSSSLLESVLNHTFHYQSKLQNESVANLNIGSDNNHGTKAPSKVSKYYSARSVRRALEYVSIDYLTFGLEVPEWAKEILRNDI